MYLLEFSMSPLGKGDSVSEYVALSLEIIDASGLDYELHAMGTIVEGELPALMELLSQCFEAMSEHSDRVSCVAKFDYRKGKQGRIAQKVKSVEAKLGRSLGRGGSA